MNWLKNVILRWLNSANKITPATLIRTTLGSPSPNEFKNPMHITLYNAVGGRIVKFDHWDDGADQNYETTYIISSDESFEEALGKCIAMEAIKHVG